MSADEQARIARIADAVFTEMCRLGDVPAMAAGVVHDGTVVGFTGHKAGADSLFRIASMTKSFTAAAILMLRDGGALRLDEPVASYAPEFASLVGPTSDAPAITVRHLLTMAAGFATDDPWGDRHLDWTDAELDAVAQSDPVFAIGPGTGFEYSNFGYGLLGRVIARTSGTRAQTFITERLLRPLGMTRTVWEAADAPAGTEIVTGVRADGVTPEIQLRDGSLSTMGGLWSTVNDLARWVGFFTDAWPPRDDPDTAPLRRSSRREMQSGQNMLAPMRVRAADGASWQAQGGYGMGLQSSFDDVLGEIIGHSGGLPGFGSNMSWVRGTGWGVIALGSKTYAPMAHANRRVLMALSASGLVRKPRPAPTAALAAAGRALFDLLSAWNDGKAKSLFADNVAPDLAFAERRVAAAALAARLGAMRLARIEATSAASARIIIQGDTSESSISFSLAPNGKIQRYDS